MNEINWIDAEEISSSIGVNDWAEKQRIREVWCTGINDQQLTGYEREDGERIIETNGDPIYENEEAFNEIWETQGHNAWL